MVRSLEMTQRKLPSNQINPNPHEFPSLLLKSTQKSSQISLVPFPNSGIRWDKYRISPLPTRLHLQISPTQEFLLWDNEGFSSPHHLVHLRHPAHLAVHAGDRIMAVNGFSEDAQVGHGSLGWGGYPNWVNLAINWIIIH